MGIRFPAHFGSRRGVTLIELMAAITVLGIGILAFFQAFPYIMVSLQGSRVRTTRIQFLRAQLESLEATNYYEIQVTTAASLIPGFGSYYPYDTVNYPPKTVTLSGVSYTMYTYVCYTSVNSASGNFFQTGFYNDTGLKQINIYLVWGNPYGPSIQKIDGEVHSPGVAPLDSGFTGAVYDMGSGAPVSGAKVATAQNPNWQAVYTPPAYSFYVAPGTYTLRASAVGYYASASAPTYVKGNTQTVDFTLQQITSGTISGISWIAPTQSLGGVLISQIVIDTVTNFQYGPQCPFVPADCTTAAGPGHVQYIELYNPTNTQVIVVSTAPGAHFTEADEGIILDMESGNYGMGADIMYYDWLAGGGHPGSGGNGAAVYVSTYIPPHGYYLFAEYPIFMVDGQWIKADAFWDRAYHTVVYLRPAYSGTVIVQNQWGVLDMVSWSGGGVRGGAPIVDGPLFNNVPIPSYFSSTPNCEPNNIMTPGSAPNYIPLPSVNGPWRLGAPGQPAWTFTGLGYGDQIVRFSVPTAAVVSSTSDLQQAVGGPGTVAGQRAYGSAYNTFCNSHDFVFPSSVTVALSTYTLGINIDPTSTQSSTPTLPIIASIPTLQEFGSGGVVVENDINSGVGYGGDATLTNFLGQPQYYSTFTLVGVSTGIWTVTGWWTGPSQSPIGPITYLEYSEIQNVNVTHGNTTQIPNTATIPPADPPLNLPNFFIGPASDYYFVWGEIDDAYGNPLSGIQVTVGTVNGTITRTTGPNGAFFAAGPANTLINGATFLDITANPNNGNPNYASVQKTQNWVLGTYVNNVGHIHLPERNMLTGFMTTGGTTPLPNAAVNANMSGFSLGQATSDNTGYFYIPNASTGTITVTPIVTSPMQEAIPAYITVTPTSSGGTVFVGTFTITGAYGTLSGNVTYNGSPVVSGALIVVSTATLSTSIKPPQINAANLSGQAPIYSASVQTDGRFSLQVQGGAANSYNILVSMPLAAANGAATSVKKLFTGITVPPGQTSPPLNLSLP